MDFKEFFEHNYTWINGFMNNVRRYRQRTALIDPIAKQSWTYEQLNQDINKFANRLLADGLVKGDVVMMELPNCPEFVFTYVTTQKIRAINSPVSFRLSPGELAYHIEDSHPQVVLFDLKHQQDMLQAIEICGWTPKRLIVVDGPSEGNIIAYADYVKDMPTTEPKVDGDYYIYDETTRLYTSGTTGRPKGVPLTSINEVLSAHDIMIHFPLSCKDITMNTTPWFHRGGVHCGGPCPALYAGACMVIMKKFDAIKTLRYVEMYNITYIIGVPTVLDALAEEQENMGYDLGPLKGIITMGSPLERSACIRYQRVLTPNIYNGYGTTESLWNTFLRPFDLPENAGTAGSSCVDDDVRVVKVYEDRKADPDDIVDDDGSEVGEVIIASPAKCPYRYHNNPVETEEKYYKGFLYTHDLGTWDENHFISIRGRKDDMIISSGENIFPVEIEEVLNTHPKVRDCMVTSVPDRVRGQKVTAYIVREDASLTAEELDDYCKASPDIANFKRPRYYRFVSTLPYNATGKKIHVKMKKIAKDDLKNGLLEEV